MLRDAVFRTANVRTVGKNGLKQYLVEVGGDASELNQVVLLQALGQRDGVKVVEGVDGGAQT